MQAEETHRTLIMLIYLTAMASEWIVRNSTRKKNLRTRQNSVLYIVWINSCEEDG